jgi:TetR/AcrR family transcriptional regulator, mexJK operon transcriptional repressor
MANGTLEPTEFKRGPGGRPTRHEAERRHVALLKTATRLFLEGGLDVVTLDEIAKQAGVAKRFIYARYRDKSELFVAAMEHCFAERLELLQAFEPPRLHAGLGLFLFQFGRKLLDIALQPDALALHRLFIASAPRFPGLAKLFIERNRHRGTGEVERVLTFYADRGEIKLQHPQIMAEQFFISVVGIPQRLALLGIRESRAQEQRRLRAAVRLFFHGCRAPRGKKPAKG